MALMPTAQRDPSLRLKHFLEGAMLLTNELSYYTLKHYFGSDSALTREDLLRFVESFSDLNRSEAPKTSTIPKFGQL